MNALKQVLEQLLFFKWAVAGVALGGIVAETLQQFGVAVTVDDGLIWGAVAGLVVTYRGYFFRSGKMVTKHDNPVVNFIAGIFVFLAISAVIVGIFFLFLYILSFFIK